MVVILLSLSYNFKKRLIIINDANIYSSDIDFWCFSMSVVADMDANDTASSSSFIPNGSAQSQIDQQVIQQPIFSGYLLVICQCEITYLKGGNNGKSHKNSNTNRFTTTNTI